MGECVNPTAMKIDGDVMDRMRCEESVSPLDSTAHEMSEKNGGLIYDITYACAYASPPE